MQQRTSSSRRRSSRLAPDRIVDAPAPAGGGVVRGAMVTGVMTPRVSLPMAEGVCVPSCLRGWVQLRAAHPRLERVRPVPHLGAGRFVVPIMDDDLDYDPASEWGAAAAAAEVPLEDPPAVLLPVLTLDEAQDVVEVLGAVVDGGEVDEQLAFCLLSNLAARIPSRDAV